MDRLVWIDCEMTGLELTRDILLEVACIVTDGELSILDEGIDIVISAPQEALAEMVPVVTEMHARSGLTQAVLDSTVTLAEAERQVLEFVKKHVPEPKKAPLCGNSIATDRGFLALHMPELDDWLHYRMIDVSSIKELARRWYPRVYFASPDKHGGHRALGDILDSVRELQYYRQTVFTPQPGPDSDTARAVAAQLSAQPADGPAACGETTS